MSKVSFVIPSHNCQTYLPHAVESCVMQTHEDIEIVIVDDASTDRTREFLDWIEEFTSKDHSKENLSEIHKAYAARAGRFKIVRLKNNVGRSEARNIGNCASSGDLICVLDADDLATPNRAELMVRKFKFGSDYVYGGATVIDAIGRVINVLQPDTFTKSKLLNSTRLEAGIVHSSVCFTKEFAKKYPFVTGVPATLGIDDFVQQTKALADGAKFDFVPQRLCAYRVHTNSITAQRNVEEVIKYKRMLVDSLFGVPA